MNHIAIAAVALTLFLVGCSAPPVASPPVESSINTSIASSYSSPREEVADIKRRATALREQRKVAKLQDEIDRLEREIAGLERRLASLEASIAASERTAQPAYTPAAAGGGGTVHTGPRGGQYTITPSGKKSYIRRK